MVPSMAKGMTKLVTPRWMGIAVIVLAAVQSAARGPVGVVLPRAARPPASRATLHVVINRRLR